jgi:hypothetical protein
MGELVNPFGPDPKAMIVRSDLPQPMDTWIIENVRAVRKSRRKKNQRMSLYRESKTMAHTTVNGVGRVGRLNKHVKL